MNIIDKLTEKQISKKLDAKVKKVLDLDSTFAKMSDEQLKAKSVELQNRAIKGEKKEALMSESFALVREATWRVLGMKQYPVQIKGGIALFEGNVAEMRTGEGKTIVAPFASYLHALAGENVHVITSNEYLAKRDSEQMSKLFNFLGMSVGLSISEQSIEEKKDAYKANITYSTCSEIGFDYLRDNLVNNADEKVLRGLHAVIIDEADDALIDDAGTPLILSSESDRTEKVLITQANRLVKTFEEEVDYVLDDETRVPYITEEGIKKVEKYFRIDNMFSEQNYRISHFVQNSLKAHFMLKKDVDYVVENGEVSIVSQSTGRLMNGRKYGDGIHQALEAKEEVEISNDSITHSTVTFQNFFRLYENVSGMTGTCKSSEDEMLSIYNLPVVQIEPNKPSKRIDYEPKIYLENTAKYEAIKTRVKELHAQGRPILLGTSSVENSLILDNILNEMGIEHTLLNAMNHEEESEIIAQAGKKGAVTIATNMAGRGTDIKLGGNPDFMAKNEMKKMGISHDLIEFADSSKETTKDEEKHARETFLKLKEEFKKETDKQKEEVKSLGGLAIVGTELNISLRVDDQLRGRAGRQGDPGSSEFFISFEDLRKNYPNLDASGYESVMTSPLQELSSIKGTLEEIMKARQVVEDKYKQSRQTNLGLNEPENRQRLAIFAERDEIIEMCEEAKEYGPEETISEIPQNAFERYIKGIIDRDIDQIVDDYYINGKTSNEAEHETLNEEPTTPHKLTPDEQERMINAYKSGKTSRDKAAKQHMRNSLVKYGVDPSFLKDTIIDESMPTELKERLVKYLFKTYKAKLQKIKETYPNFDDAIKQSLLSTIDECWAAHIEHLQTIKTKIFLAPESNQSAIPDFVHEAYYLFESLKDETSKTAIADISKLVYNKYNAVIAMEKQQNIAQQATITGNHSTPKSKLD